MTLSYLIRLRELLTPHIQRCNFLSWEFIYFGDPILFFTIVIYQAFFYLGISGKCVYSKITALDRGPHPDLKTGITAAQAERQRHQTLSSKGKWKAFRYCHMLSLPSLVDIALINKMWPGQSTLMCFGEGEVHVLGTSGTTRSEVPRWK